MLSWLWKRLSKDVNQIELTTDEVCALIDVIDGRRAQDQATFDSARRKLVRAFTNSDKAKEIVREEREWFKGRVKA